MSSLTAIFGSAEEKDKEQDDSQKLLDLYWNRAELKKEFAGMRKERFRLQDRIKQQEGASARLQQKLDHLEDLLLDSQWVYSSVVFYQLRSVALQCENKLAKFAEQLKQQREQKQHNSLLVQWNENRSAEARSVEQQVLSVRESIQTMEDQLQSERRRLMNMSGFLKIFRRRSVTAILDDLAAKIDSQRQEDLMLTQKLDEINGRRPPDNEGLGTNIKRTINLMIMSFAQQMYINFDDDELAQFVKESAEKSVGAINYGDRRECNLMLDKIDAHRKKMEQATDFAEVLQHRAKLIHAKALYKDDQDAVPVPGSVTTLFKIDPSGLVREFDANVFGENYWGVSKVLSR